MADTSSTDSSLRGWPFSALSAWPQWPGLAPKNLMQDINSGWSFGNVITINSVNSSAPDVERAVVSQDSYGRQIGRLMDAVAALIEAAPVKGDDKRIVQFRELAARVKKVKDAMAPQKLERLKGEIQELRESKRDEDRAAFDELKKLFGRN